MSKIVLSAPYPEGAIVQLAKHPQVFHREVIAFLPSRALSVSASRILGRSRKMEGRLLRGSDDVPGARYLRPSLEALRLVGRVPGLRRLLPSSMDSLKIAFDDAVASEVREGAEVLVGMPGASLRSFQTPGIEKRVFHAVDAHPEALNRILQMHYGSKADRELVSPSRVERINAELALADLVMVPSTLVREQMLKEGVSAQAIRVLPYGTNLREFKPSSVAQNSIPHILYVGQVSYRKGIPFLLEAVRNQRLTVEMVGPVVAPELLSNLPDNVVHRPAVSHGDLPHVFGRADALVVPSVEDAYALVVTEALGSGLPVITTRSVGASVLVKTDADGEVIAAGDTEALRSALNHVAPQTVAERSIRAARHRTAESEVITWNEYATRVASAIRGAE